MGEDSRSRIAIERFADALKALDGPGLHGENVNTTFIDDARHWTGVYRELLAFKSDLIGRTVERMEQMQPDARTYVETTDLQPLRVQADKLRRRVLFWEGRMLALEPEARSG